MIFGIGTDIADVRRFQKWVLKDGMCERFFNQRELMEKGSLSARCCHYAARFAAKEAFSKALGTGLCFDLKNVYITNDDFGKPFLNVCGDAKELLFLKAGECKVHVSLSHERDFATAFVVIECIQKSSEMPKI